MVIWCLHFAFETFNSNQITFKIKIIENNPDSD
jgi:hypothetical protein